MPDVLANLPRLPADAMAPCIACNRQLLETELPVFFRIESKQCGLDLPEIRRHVGLAQFMGGGQDGLVLAEVLGPRIQPVIVMETITTFNICQRCATDGVGLLDAIGMQWERDRKSKGLSVPDRRSGAEGDD